GEMLLVLPTTLSAEGSMPPPPQALRVAAQPREPGQVAAGSQNQPELAESRADRPALSRPRPERCWQGVSVPLTAVCPFAPPRGDRVRQTKMATHRTALRHKA